MNAEARPFLPGRLPKVVVVLKEPPNEVFGAGITVMNLFRSWPPESVLFVYWSEIEPLPGWRDRSVALSDDEFGFRFPLSILRRGALRRSAPQVAAEPKGGHDAGRRLGLRAFLAVLKATFGTNPWIHRVRLSRQVSKRLLDFAPDLIYCSPVALPGITLVRKIQRLTGAGMVVHIYDDWIPNVPRSGLLGQRFAECTERAFRRLLEDAALRLAIGESMADEYRRRYNLEFSVFQNCPDLDLWRSRGVTHCSSRAEFVVRFLGTVYGGGNLEAIARFGRLVQLASEQGRRMVLSLVVPRAQVVGVREQLCENQFIEVSAVPDQTEALASMMRDADALLLAMDVSSHSNSLSLSMPTKLPAYMVAGVPILIFAPRGFAVRDYLVNRCAGAWIDPRESDHVNVRTLRRFIDDEPGRRQIAAAATRVADREFDPGVVRERFAGQLSAARNPPISITP